MLTPLFPEEVLFIVRADSPLKYIHQLRGRRLSIGPVQGDGSHTVREIYRRLFGAEMTEPEQFDNDQALGELVAFRSIDAMAIVDGPTTGTAGNAVAVATNVANLGSAASGAYNVSYYLSTDATITQITSRASSERTSRTRVGAAAPTGTR